MKQSSRLKLECHSFREVLCNRYDLSFSRHGPQKKQSHSFRCNYQQTPLLTTSDPRMRSQSPQFNKTFSKYQNFPSNHKTFQSLTRNTKDPQIKWLGSWRSPQQEVEIQEKVNRNYFPMRKKKNNNQTLINMLYKYEKCYGKNKPGTTFELYSQDSLQSSKRSSVKKQPKTKFVRSFQLPMN